jgi:4-hydroxyisophthalate hydroxylase
VSLALLAGLVSLSLLFKLAQKAHQSSPLQQAESFVENRYQVIIVGGGPVGVALALNLGLAGVSCALIETRTEMHRIPKGQNLTQRTLEHFYFWGIADELRAARLLPKDMAIGEITAYGNLMSDYWHAPAGRELVRPFYFQDNDRLPQYQMEAVLRRKLATVSEVKTFFGYSATAIEQDESSVRVTMVEESGTRCKVLTADYVVGCDGAHSTVRKQAGIERCGTDFDQLMVLLVFRSRELNELLKRFPPRSTYRVMHPNFSGYWQFFGRIDGDEGFFFHAPIRQDTKRDGFDFRGPLRQAVGADFAVEFDYTGFWELRNAVAETYQSGRVFIAGDAAHSHPPYGGFGLNNGLEDAINLSWKLTAKLQGWGGEGLLQSYSQERQPIFRDIAEEFIAARIRLDDEFLAQYNPVRNKPEFEKAWAARETDIGSRVQSYEPNYEGSPIVVGPPNGVCTARGFHSFRARAGHHLSPQQLSSGQNIFEKLGSGFTLIALDAAEKDVTQIERMAATEGMPLKVVRDPSGEDINRYGYRLILVRPDQFVAWTGDVMPDDVHAVIRKVTGRCEAH